MRRAANVDINHGAVVECLRACGCVVQSLAPVGEGVPDLLVGHPATRRLMLVEVKNPKKSPAHRALRPVQVEWHEAWAGLPVYVVEHLEDVPGLLAGVPAVLERCSSAAAVQRSRAVMARRAAA